MLRMKHTTLSSLSVQAEWVILHLVLNGAERCVNPVCNTHNWFHKEACHALRYATKSTEEPACSSVLKRTFDCTINGCLDYSRYAVKNTAPNIANASEKAFRHASSAISELFEIACTS